MAAARRQQAPAVNHVRRQCHICCGRYARNQGDGWGDQRDWCGVGADRSDGNRRDWHHGGDRCGSGRNQQLNVTATVLPHRDHNPELRLMKLLRTANPDSLAGKPGPLLRWQLPCLISSGWLNSRLCRSLLIQHERVGITFCSFAFALALEVLYCSLRVKRSHRTLFSVPVRGLASSLCSLRTILGRMPSSKSNNGCLTTIWTNCVDLQPSARLVRLTLRSNSDTTRTSLTLWNVSGEPLRTQQRPGPA